MASRHRRGGGGHGPGWRTRVGGGPDLGDAGELLDATAKATYQTRLTELRAELEEAEGCNDPARAATARQEMKLLPPHVGVRLAE